MKKLTAKNLIAFLALAVLVNFVPCNLAPAQDTKADTVLLNGKFFTGVASQPYVQAIAIRGERIMATGDTKTIQALAGPNTVSIDLHGSTPIRAINNPHHLLTLG